MLEIDFENCIIHYNIGDHIMNAQNMEGVRCAFLPLFSTQLAVVKICLVETMAPPHKYRPNLENMSTCHGKRQSATHFPASVVVLFCLLLVLSRFGPFCMLVTGSSRMDDDTKPISRNRSLHIFTLIIL